MQNAAAKNIILPIAIGFGIGYILKKYAMGNKITKNFSLDEFQSTDGAVMPMYVKNNIYALADNLQTLRDYYKLPIQITSGYRSPAKNKQVKGARFSQHLYGRAADFKIKGKTPIEIAKTIEMLIDAGKMEQGGIGIYPTWVHYDIRGTKARW